MLTDALTFKKVLIKSHNIEERKSNPNFTILSGSFEEVFNSKNVTVKFAAEIF